MNPNQPAPAAPAAPVSDATAMAGLINSLPPAPAPAGGIPQAPAAPIIPDVPDNVINFDMPSPDLMAPPAAPAPYYAPAPAAPLPPAPAPAAGVPAPQIPPVPQINPDIIPLVPSMPMAQPPAPQQQTFTAEQVQQIIAGIQSGQPAPQAPAAPPAAWTPESWADVEARIKAEAASIVQQSQTAQQAAERAQADEAENQRRNADQFIDTQIANLEQTGYLPPITNPNDSNDAGRAARAELYAYAISLGTDNLTAVAPNLYALHQNGYFYDRTRNSLVRRGSATPGAQAPIAGAGPVGGPAVAPVGPTMHDLATKDIYTLADEANRAFPVTPPNA